MALHMALVMLSLLLLLEAQNPELANITIGDPIINNETLSWLSDKWFLIGAASQNPELQQQSIQEKLTVFLYLTPNLIKDKMEIQEYQTLGDQCEYYTNHLGFQKENGALSLYEGGKSFAHLIVLKKHGAIILAFNLKDEKKRVLTLWAKKPDITLELREVFQKAVKHVGMDESEIIFVDRKKDRCGQQEKKQLELGKETKKDPEEGQA